jgi:hypothetical protein
MVVLTVYYITIVTDIIDQKLSYRASKGILQLYQQHFSLIFYHS